MTCYNCNNCGRYEHISRMLDFEVQKKIGKITIKDTLWLCKWCLTKAGIKYYIDKSDGWISRLPLPLHAKARSIP